MYFIKPKVNFPQTYLTYCDIYNPIEVLWFTCPSTTFNLFGFDLISYCPIYYEYKLYMHGRRSSLTVVLFLFSCGVLCYFAQWINVCCTLHNNCYYNKILDIFIRKTWRHQREVIRNLSGVRTDNTIVKRKMSNRKSMIYKTLHRKRNLVQHETHWNPGVIEFTLPFLNILY